MNSIIKVFVLWWLFVTIFVTSILLYNLSVYLLETPFIEWHIMLLYVLIIPISTMIIFIAKHVKEKTND